MDLITLNNGVEMPAALPERAWRDSNPQPSDP